MVKLHIDFNGNREWLDMDNPITDGEYIYNIRHRLNGPAYICWNGLKEYWVNGLKHREDGPAEEYYDGGKMYYINGNLHREDGPAAEWTEGDKLNQIWVLHGQILECDTQQEFERMMKLRTLW